MERFASVAAVLGDGASKITGERAARCIARALDRARRGGAWVEVNAEVGPPISDVVRDVAGSRMGRRVSVFWGGSTDVISVEMTRLVASLDDVWMPSRDDVCIVSEDGEWLLVVDHEEHVSLFDLPPDLVRSGGTTVD